MTREVTITIDGRSIRATEGANLLQTARDAGIDIPGLCFHPKLTPTGSCRLCMVTVSGKTVPACMTYVTEGMEVSAFDEELESRRVTGLDIILNEHECACTGCHMAGGCTLQDLAHRYGLIGLNRRRFRRFYSEIERKLSRLPGLDRILNRVAARKTPTMDDPAQAYSGRHADCVRCGYCIEACPMDLYPIMIVDAYLQDDRRLLKRLYPEDCIRCDMCAYCCPGEIKLPWYIRQAVSAKQEAAGAAG